MNSFQYSQAKTVEDACALLRQHKGARIIAGGTDLVLELNEGHANTDHIVNISKLRDLKYVRCEGGKVRIGALSTFAELDQNDYIREHVKVLHTAASNMGSPQIRNLATIGGNLVNASVAGDSLGSMIALDATVVLQGPEGKREMKLVDFYAGKEKTQIAPDEIMTEIYFDQPDDNTATAFVKLAKREALAIVVIDICGVVSKDAAGNCTKAQIAVGAVGRYPFRIKAVEEFLVGKPLNKANCDTTLPMISQAVYDSISNRPSVTYKKESVKGIAVKMYDSLLKDLNL